MGIFDIDNGFEATSNIGDHDFWQKNRLHNSLLPEIVHPETIDMVPNAENMMVPIDDSDLYMSDEVGSSDMILSYPDPLAHVADYHPDPFLNDYNDGLLYNESNPIIGYQMGADGGLMPAIDNVDELPGIEKGMLKDGTHLDAIIQLGEIEGTQHISSDDIVRDENAKETFLHQHGYTEVPSGYEVHHIVPLSQGGADVPSNMVLLTEEQHTLVTNAHRQYYGW